MRLPLLSPWALQNKWLECRRGRRSTPPRSRRCGFLVRTHLPLPAALRFCYNPVDFSRTGAELTTDEWLRVLREARAAGAVQLGLSVGEPLVRDDVETSRCRRA